MFDYSNAGNWDQYPTSGPSTKHAYIHPSYIPLFAHNMQHVRLFWVYRWMDESITNGDLGCLVVDRDRIVGNNYLLEYQQIYILMSELFSNNKQWRFEWLIPFHFSPHGLKHHQLMYLNQYIFLITSWSIVYTSLKDYIQPLFIRHKLKHDHS